MQENNQSNFPRPLEAILVIIASFIFVVIVTQSIMWVLMPGAEDINRGSTGLKILITFGEIGLIIVPLIFIKSRNLSFRQVFRWKAIPPSIITWSVVLGFSISIIGDELDRLVSMIIPAPEFVAELSEAMRISSSADFFILMSGAVIAAAFIEESIIRGFLQKSLEKYQDVTRAVIYASLAWTIIHGMLFWAIQIFLLGIILGLLAWRSDSIWPSAIAHGMNNTAALIFYNINPEHLEGYYLWGNHVSPVVLVIALGGLIYGVRAFYQFYGSSPNFPVSTS